MARGWCLVVSGQRSFPNLANRSTGESRSLDSTRDDRMGTRASLTKRLLPSRVGAVVVTQVAQTLEVDCAADKEDRHGCARDGQDAIHEKCRVNAARHR